MRRPEPVQTVELFAPDRAARRLSTPVLRDLLASVGPPLFDYFASLDLDAIGSGVSPAGLDRAPVWLDVAGDAWRLHEGASEAPAARVTLDEGTTWRLFTKGVSPEEARRVATIDGDPRLGERVLNAVAIIA